MRYFCEVLKSNMYSNCAIINYFYLILIDAKEVVEDVPDDVVQLCKETFKKTADYLHGELEGNTIKFFCKEK